MLADFLGRYAAAAARHLGPAAAPLLAAAALAAAASDRALNFIVVGIAPRPGDPASRRAAAALIGRLAGGPWSASVGLGGPRYFVSPATRAAGWYLAAPSAPQAFLVCGRASYYRALEELRAAALAEAVLAAAGRGEASRVEASHVA